MAGVRRTWDKEYYAAKARERQEKGDDFDVQVKKPKVSVIEREELKAADADADGPVGSDRAFLNSRANKIDLESKVGKVEIIKEGEANSSQGTRVSMTNFLH